MEGNQNLTKSMGETPRSAMQAVNAFRANLGVLPRNSERPASKPAEPDNESPFVSLTSMTLFVAVIGGIGGGILLAAALLLRTLTNSAAFFICMGLLALIATCFYLLPFLIALCLDHPRRYRVLAWNLLTGWFFVGWVFVMVAVLHPMFRERQSLRKP